MAAYLGKYLVNLTAYLVTDAVAPYMATRTVSNHLKVTSAKHRSFARDVQTTTYHLSSTKRNV